jgi:hypothetical protein
MAKLARRRHVATATVRRGPSPTIAKLHKKLAAARARKKESKSVNAMTALVVTGAALGLGYLQKGGNMPPTLLGLNAPLVVGAVGAFAVPHFVGGTVGRLASHVGLGALAVAGVQIGGGAPVMSGDGW